MHQHSTVLSDLLQKIGWIKLDESADPSAITQDDITENPHNIKFTEMNSMTIPATMADFDYVAITGKCCIQCRNRCFYSTCERRYPRLSCTSGCSKKENKDAAWAQAIVDAYSF